MKKLILFSFLLTSIISVFSQSKPEIGYYYEFSESRNIIKLNPENIKEKIVEYSKNTDVEIDFYEDLKFNADNTDTFLSTKTGWVFKYVKMEGNLYIIKFISVDKENDSIKNNFYGVSKNQFLNSVKEYDGDNPKTSFVTSAIMIPIKMRFGDSKSGEDKKRYFDFEGNYNIGITAGFRDRISRNGKNYMNYLGGINIGAAKITPETANILSETNASILTPFFGVMFEYNNFQIGIFSGADFIAGKIGESWVYQGKMWLGFGLGYNIFTTKENL